MLLLLGLAGLYLRTPARDRDLRALPPPVDEAAPAVAVLPFAVQDGALASWREGLVDLISIDLTGVAGLRSVDSRTLLARWRERVRGADIPELATAMDVADRAGARYAVVGSVIASGPDLLLTAERASGRGPPDARHRQVPGPRRQHLYPGGSADARDPAADPQRRGARAAPDRSGSNQHRLATGAEVLPGRRGVLPEVSIPERGGGLREGCGC